MGRGSLLGREQKAVRRQQTQWAGMQAAAYRARLHDPMEALLRREAMRTRMAERYGDTEAARQAQKEAEEQAEKDRLEAEAKAKELFRQERERIVQARKARRVLAQQAKATLREQQEIAKVALQQQAIAAEQAIQEQWSRDLETLSDLRSQVPVLQRKAQRALERVEKLQHLLGAHPADPHLVTANANDAILHQILARCSAAAIAISAAHATMMLAHIDVTEAATRTAVVSLAAEIAALAVDENLATQALADTAASELTYQAQLAAIAAYPNLNLTLDLMANPLSPMTLFTAAQLSRLNTKLFNHPVLTWEPAYRPASRATMPHAQFMMPTTVQGIPYRMGAEIFCDWIIENPGHGQVASRMAKFLNPIYDKSMKVQVIGQLWSKMYLNQSFDKWKVTIDNVETNIIFSQDKSVLITFYLTI